MSWFTTPKVFTAGQKARAADVDENFTAIEEALNDLFQMGSAGASANVTPAQGGPYVDVPGAAATITVPRSSFVLVTTFFDFVEAGSSSGGAECLGALNVDGAVQAAVARLEGFANATLWKTAATVGQSYVIPLDVGAHTLKLQVRKENVAPAECKKTNTRFTYLVLPDPEP